MESLLHFAVWKDSRITWWEIWAKLLKMPELKCHIRPPGREGTQAGGLGSYMRDEDHQPGAISLWSTKGRRRKLTMAQRAWRCLWLWPWPPRCQHVMGQEQWAQGYQRAIHFALVSVTASWGSRGRNNLGHHSISLLHFRRVKQGLTDDTVDPQYPSVLHLQIQSTTDGKYLERKFQKIPKGRTWICRTMLTWHLHC